MEKKRPQLNSDELQLVRWWLGGLLALISVATVLYLEVDAWVLMGLATVAITAVLVRPSLPARVPPLAHKLAFPFIVVIFAWDLYATAEVLPAMIRLDLLLLLYRGVSYRKKRDDLQIILLGLFLVMIAGVLTVSLAFAIQILVFTAGTLAFLFVITLAEAAEGGAVPAAGRAPAWTGLSGGRVVRRLRETTDWRVAALGGGLFGGVVAVSALLFMIIPRFQLENSFFLDRFMTKKSLTGFSDTIRLGDLVDIQEDNTVALRVDVSDAALVPTVPYWRMLALDEYQDGTFRTSRRLRNEMVIGAQMRPFLQGVLARPADAPAYWTFYFEAGISRYLPLAGPFGLLRFREPQWVQQQNVLYLIALRNEPVTMTAYRVEGMSTDGFLPDRMFGARLRNARRALAPGATGREERDEPGTTSVGYPLTTLQLPPRAGDQEALRQAVATVTGGAHLNAAEFAARASRWLREQHAYALRVTPPGGHGDPVVAWLTSDQPGHCELFTAAFTLLARTAGFPTRAVTGFKGGDWNAYENYFMVRNSHAHAWCEVYDGGAGWFRVDPTAGAAAVSARGQGPAGAGAASQRADRSWTARIDAIRILWYRRIVSFDQRTQLALMESFKETVGHLNAAVHDVLEGALSSLRRWLRGPWDLRRVLGWGAGAAGAVAAVAGWRRFGRAWWWRTGGVRRGDGPDPVRREAGRWLRKLGEGRTSKAEGPRPKVEDPGVRADLQRLRYGRRETWPAPPAVFRRVRRALRAERRAVSRR